MKRLLITASIAILTVTASVSAASLDDRRALIMQKWDSLSDEAKSDMVDTAREKSQTRSEVRKERLTRIREQVKAYEPVFRELESDELVQDLRRVINEEKAREDSKVAELIKEFEPRAENIAKEIRDVINSEGEIDIPEIEQIIADVKLPEIKDKNGEVIENPVAREIVRDLVEQEVKETVDVESLKQDLEDVKVAIQERDEEKLEEVKERLEQEIQQEKIEEVRTQLEDRIPELKDRREEVDELVERLEPLVKEHKERILGEILQSFN